MTAPHTTIQCRATASRNGYRRIEEVLGLLCELYNAALEERKGAYSRNGETRTLYHQYRELTAIRNAIPEFAALDTSIGRGPLKRLDLAFNAFFRRVKEGGTPGFPRFKPRSRYTCINLSRTMANHVRRSECGHKAVVKIKGLPMIRVKSSRILPPSDQLVDLRIMLKPNGLMVDLVYAVEREPLEPTGRIVGIDAGVAQRLTLSDGSVIGRRVRTRRQRKQRRLQRGIERCNRGSNVRRKRMKQLARLRRREQVADRNADHRITTDIVRNHDLIAVEALQVQNMTRSGKGKRGLNRAITEQSWGRLRNQLAYKAEWAGREYREVDPRYTSQTCSVCGHIDAESRRSQSRFRCTACGARLNADLNAARNILRKALPSGGWDRAAGSPSVR